MKRQIQYPQLLSALKAVQLLTPEISPDKAFKEIKILDPRIYDQLVRECRYFQENLERATEDCQSAVESPIYIGVVGHYSHGKSSLLNALLFPPRTGEVLPTGEGVVTSLCTLLQFSNHADDHEFYDVEQGNVERNLTSGEYQSRVSSRGGRAGSTSYFKIRLQVDRLSDSLFNDFAEKQIEMLDTPGLGGPFWKDEQSLIGWIKEFVMVVVCIKATQINGDTADTINPFLRQTTKPIVPVVTFWDTWNGSGDFKGIGEESKARAEAKRRISQYFPTLAQYVDQTIFTSAKACMEAKPITDDATRFFTEEWNVDNVRRSLSSHVRTQGNILRAGKDKESALDSQRRALVRQLAEKLSADSLHYTDSLRTKIQEALPKGEHDQVIQLMKDDMDMEVEREIERITNQIERTVSRKIPLINNSRNWGAETAKLKQDAECEYLKLKREGVTRIASFVDRFNQTHIDPLIRQAGLRDVDRKRLDQEVKRHSDEFKRSAGDSIEPPDIVEIPSVFGEAAKNTLQAAMSFFKQLLITNAPFAIGLIVAIPIIMSFSWILSRVPYINILVPALIGLYGFVLLVAGWSHFQNARKLTLLEAHGKMLRANGPAEISSRIEKDFQSAVSSLHRKLADSLETRLAPLDLATRGVLELLRQNLDQLEEKIRDVRQLI